MCQALARRKGGERCQESDSPHRLVSVEVFMEDFMILNIINFADIARRENKGVSYDERGISDL